MNIFKFLSFVILSLILCSQSFSIDNNELKESVAKLMNVKFNDIKLKKQKLGMTSSQSYICEINGQKYILKLFKKRTKSEQRKNEMESVKILSKLDLGPKLVAAAEDDSFYIREYTKGKLVKSSDFQNEKVLINFAKALKKLHSYNTDMESQKTLINRSEKHYKSIMKKKVALPFGFEKSYAKFQELYSKLPNQKGFCHNDLNPLNILISKNGEVSFIDLENCGNANVYEELGYATLLCGISDKNLELFLKSYLERNPSQTEIAAVKLAQKLVSFLTFAVWLDFSESKKDKKIPIETRRKALNDLLNSKDLKTAEDFINENKTVSIKSRNKMLIKQYALAFYKRYLNL